VDRAQAVALALPIVAQAERFASLAGSVLTASDAEFEQRLRSMVEAILVSDARPMRSAPDDVEESS
jgi:hypothetical protein